MTKLVRFDWAIKYLLRNKANFDILEGFLSELLKTSIHIEHILESESNKNHEDDKYNRVDLLVNTEDGQYIIVEIQCSRQWDFLSRVLYGASKVVCEHISEGEKYGKIRKIISISIVFFDLGHGQDYLYKGTTSFRGFHYDDTLELNEGERAVYAETSGLRLETPAEIFPEYYIVKVTQFHEKVKNKIDEWIYFLKHGKVEQSFKAQGLKSAMKKLDILRLSEQDRRAYEKYRESLMDHASFEAELNYENKKGREEGLQTGIDQGYQKILEIARSLKKIGMPDKDIAKHTGLPTAVIKELLHLESVDK